jgi:hypothetical protein
VLRRAVIALVTATTAATACGDDGGSARDPLAERLVALLEADAEAIDGDVAAAQVTCPTVPSPEPGDVATCVVRFDDGRRLEVDVEFQADGAIVVVAVVP